MYYYVYNRLTAFFARTTWASWHQKGRTILHFNEGMGVAVASAGPYANHDLHLAPGR